jgi:hypothetical protein
MIAVIVASRAILLALASRPPKAVPHPPDASDRQFDRHHEIQDVGGIGEEVVQRS